DVVAMLLAVRGPHSGPRERRVSVDQIDDATRTIPEVSRTNRLAVQRDGPRELREYLDQIDDAIRTIPEVSRINRLGEQREELRVSTTNARLAGFGVTPMDVAGAIRARTSVVDAGTIDAGDAARVPIAANNLVQSEDALTHLLVGTSRDG